MKSAVLRQSFIDFFKDKDHTLVSSDNIVPHKDPTLLFTTAGMVQFKALWMGAPLPYKRAISVQKSFRAGGKSSDLENVGKTLRHHTFFEMMGNFSFGNYFKEEAIVWAWEFVTQVLKMDTDRLWVSVYKDDTETALLWVKKVGFPKERIVRLGARDNFWGPAGSTGACGPCSELHIDLGPEKGCSKKSCMVGCDCERYLEFWNLVFPQFNQESDGSRLPLERRGIDTGMGLERLAYIMQGVNSTYETDLFQPLIRSITSHTSIPYHLDASTDFAINVIADHIRALTFALTENIVPSNEGRGYVLRRILRRAYRFGTTRLGQTQSFMHKLVPSVVETMGDVYPELKEAQSRVSQLIKLEENAFQKTLTTCNEPVQAILQEAKETGSPIKGEEMFKLYDTYGFPIDMLREIAAEKDLQLDEAGFDICMTEQKERARKGWGATKNHGIVNHCQDLLAKEGSTRFVGYEDLTSRSQVIGFFREGKAVETVSAGEDNLLLVCDTTPFYAESGGQAGDQGLLQSGKAQGEISNTEKIIPEIYAHSLILKEGSLSLGDKVNLFVDEPRRKRIACNHTATHILHSVLRSVLGDDVKQAGSLVEDSYLRFDFSYFERISLDQLFQIEQLVNENIWANLGTNVSVQTLAEAKASGAMAFFDEKYGNQVRVVSLGEMSRELCGGTHTDRTGNIGIFKIISETSVASGTRRIVARTGLDALQHEQSQERLLKDLSESLKSSESDLLGCVNQLKQHLKNLDKQLQVLQRKEVMASLAGSEESIQDLGKDLSYLAQEVAVADAGGLKDLCDSLKLKHPKTIVVLGSNIDGKAVFVVASPKVAIQKGVRAGNIAKALAKKTGGGGGGGSNFAQSGSKNGVAVTEAIAGVPEILTSFLK